MVFNILKRDVQGSVYVTGARSMPHDIILIFSYYCFAGDVSTWTFRK